MRSKRRRFARLGLACLLVCALAWQSPAGATPTDDARENFKKGIAAYNLGDYDKAILHLRASYEQSNAPSLLFNIAQAYRAKKDYRKSALFYRNYLRVVPDAPNRADAEALAREVEEHAAQQERAAEEERRAHAADEAARRAADDELRKISAESEVERRARVLASQQLDAQIRSAHLQPPKPVWKKPWFWIVIGGVAVGGAVATGVLVDTYGKRDVLPTGSLGAIDGR